MGEQLLLSLAKKLQSLLAFDMNAFFFEEESWAEIGVLLLKLKAQSIICRRLTADSDTDLFGITDKLADIVNGAEDIDYAMIDLVLSELRWTLLGEADQIIPVWDSSENAIDEDEDLESVSQWLISYGITCESDQNSVADMLLNFKKQYLEYTAEYGAYCVRIRKLPWIHKALQTKGLNSEVMRLLKYELMHLESEYYVDGTECIYCLDAVRDTDVSYEHYPSMFAPMRLILLEKLAESACMAVDGKGSE